MAQEFHDRIQVTDMSVEYIGNYTIASVTGHWVDENTTETAIGIAKYNPHDAKIGLPYSVELGNTIAIGRAKKALYTKLKRNRPLPFAA